MSTNNHHALQKPMTNGVAAVKKCEANVRLKNWETRVETHDTLCGKKQTVTGCTRSRCGGSVMLPDHMSANPKKSRTTDEVLELATAFIREYYGSIKTKNPQAEINRLAEVVQSINDTGTYDLTEYELTYGAKTAWRNAPRCIGRIQWNKLQVFDCRHVQTTSQMFEAICKHLHYATNKGNIRSCITFFRQRTDPKTDFRVWNRQYIRYAGYLQEDGSVIGDQDNVEFTELCVKLGWVPKGGRFDVLPLVLQANGEDPDMFELPEDLVLEVQLRHPKFEWFKDLGFRWYAVPAVSNMLLDIGGVQFPAAPFNGWFMGTEIGRDLCDTARYNALEIVGIKMGLDVKNITSLWKDKALVEYNIAILHSYQEDHVTIMDHHSATHSFMKHYTNEVRTRGGCPGDWVWLTPPISGSLTPIFHQEILNYSLNPSCDYQPDPWRYHVWKGEAEKERRVKSFKSVGRFVHVMSTMMRSIMAKRIKATVLYASETGKSLEYAKTLKHIFDHAFSTEIHCMEDYEVWNLEHESLVLVVTSTFGNGDPPENGEAFAQDLLKLTRRADEDWSKSKRQRFNSMCVVTPISRRKSSNLKELPKIDEAPGKLENLKFAVFGLGSRAYPHFCAFAHSVDSLLGGMQGERLTEIAEGDELCGQEESFRNWAKDVFRVACDTFCVGEDVTLEAANSLLKEQDRSWSTGKFRVVPHSGRIDHAPIVEKLSACTGKNLSVCILSQRTNLLSKDASRETILVELDSSSAVNMMYEPGDHVGIYPCNQPELVERLLSQMDGDLDPDKLIELEILETHKSSLGTTEEWLPDTRLPTCTLREAFERYLDINACPSPQLLKIFSQSATDEKEKKRLEELAEGKFDYEEWKLNYTPNLPEVLAEFSSVSVEPSLLLSQLPHLQCRYYSISSSPATYPGAVHCTVAVVSYRTKGGDGTEHHGVCSSYLNRLELGSEIYCFIRSAVAFRMPEDPTTPCLLIGPGTGIAPFRSFWQQRISELEKERNVGDMAFLFGCRRPDQDHLYQEEIEEAQNRKAITLYDTAYSRIPGRPKQYVQDILRKYHSDLAYDWIVNRGGHLYICGDATMAGEVIQTFTDIVAEKKGMTNEEATAYVADMKTRSVLHEDIFGITQSTNAVLKSAKRKQSHYFEDIVRRASITSEKYRSPARFGNLLTV